MIPDEDVLGGASAYVEVVCLQGCGQICLVGEPDFGGRIAQFTASENRVGRGSIQ